MRRSGIAALAAGGDRARPDLRAELDDRDEAVAVIAVHVPGRFAGRAPNDASEPYLRGRERYRDARRIVAERRLDRRARSLEAVDLAPRHRPAAEVALSASRPRRRAPRLSAPAVVSRASRVHVDVLVLFLAAG